MIEHIKRARVNSGLTQKEVELKLDLRNLMIRDYEIGRLKLPVTMALELSKLYGVTLDELLGNEVQVKGHDDQVLDNFKTLFKGNGFEVMFLDPVIRAFLEEHRKGIFSESIFELITKDLNEKKTHLIVLELSRFIYSVAGADGKISVNERRCVNYLLDSYNIQNKIRLASSSLNELYLPEETLKEFSRIELKHFTIWILFLFASADGEITYQEIEYIDNIAECLKVNRSNFLNIKENFVKEEL